MDQLDVLEEISAISSTQLALKVPINSLTILLDVEIPRDVFQKYRNENLRKNMLEAIQEVDPQQAELLQNAPVMQLQNFINQHNAKITGEPVPMMGQAMPHAVQPMNPQMMMARPPMVRS